MMFEQGVIRPPSEAESLLVRVTRNCPWNQCLFCPAYKGTTFSLRGVDEIKSDIDQMAEMYGINSNRIRTAFFQDADSLILPTHDLISIIEYLKEKFPDIERITTYARAKSMKKKSVNELKQLKTAGLTRIHTGLESGSRNVLKLIKKGESPEDMIEGGRRVMESGISLSEYIIPGLGGRQFSNEHAVETARVLNIIRPNFIRVRTFTMPPDSPLNKMVEEGEFDPMDDLEIIKEIRELLTNLEPIHSHFRSGDFSINLLMDVDGFLDTQKPQMIKKIDAFRSFPESHQKAFILLHRSGYFFQKYADVFKDNALIRKLTDEIEGLEKERPDGFQNQIRKMMAYQLPPPQTDNWT